MSEEPATGATLAIYQKMISTSTQEQHAEELTINKNSSRSGNNNNDRRGATGG